MQPNERTRGGGENPRRGWFIIGALGLLVVGLWAFPAFWYNRVDTRQDRLWLRERDQIEGWTFTKVPVGESAERLLEADFLFSGVFTNQTTGVAIQAFSSKRYSDKADEVGLFMHTPDRCWTDAGWTLLPVTPDVLRLTVRGIPMLFERRLFSYDGERHLVYFGGMVGGQPVPYRLDHNLSIGLKRALRVAAGTAESGVRAADTRFWGRIWQGFVDRNPLLGPKQFVRLSVACEEKDLAKGDQLLQDFLGRWLEPSDYEAELKAWQRGSKAEPDSAGSREKGSG